MRLRASGDQSSTDRAAARASWWGWAALLACTLASPSAAALPDAAIHGYVFDAAAGTAAPVVGARVFFWQNAAPVTLTTDAAGAFSFTLALPDGETFALWVSAEGYFMQLLTYDVAELRRSGRIDVALEAAPARVTTVVTGLVYDVSIGPDAPIAGARVAYEYYGGGAYPDVSDVVLADADGRYRIELPFGPNDALALSVQADGYGMLRYGTGASELSTGAPIDFGLPPIGGVARVAPDQASFVCGDRFTVTVTNVGPPGETLTIVDFQFGFAYSQGVYGQNFAWDIDQIEFPLFLAPGEQVAFPVWFDPGQFASRLYVDVISGSRAEATGTYFGGRNADCGCRGDCDGDGEVSIGELVRAVSLVLGAPGIELCPLLDVDADGLIAVTEVLTAVGNALRGCAS